MSDAYDLGILFVHGIGAQKRGDTLLGFGEPLAESLNDWLTDETNPRPLTVRRTELLTPEGRDPAHTQVTVRRPDGEIRELLVAESWWADAFRVPSWLALVKWLFWCIPFVVLRATDHRVSLIETHNRIDEFRPDTHAARWLFYEAARVAKNVLSVALTLVAGVAVVLLGIVAMVPRLRTSFLGAQKLLVRYIGDSYLLLRSAGRGDAMVSQVERDLEWIEMRTPRRVVVIAHSQGADVLRRVLERRDVDAEPIASLMTLGSGIAKLRAVDRLQMQKNRGAALRAYLWRGAAALITTLPLALAVVGVIPGSLGLVVIVVVVATLVAGVVASLMIARARRLLIEIVGDDDELRGYLTPMAGQTKRWLDFYATSDPVPEGALPIAGLGPNPASSQRIANRRSPLLDHTSYWQNAEAFRSAVIGELAGLIGWDVSPADIADAQQDRYFRSRSLVTWRFVVAGAAVAAFVGLHITALWDNVADWLGNQASALAPWFADGVADWLDDPPGQDVVTVAMLIVLAVVVYAAIAGRWRSDAARRGRDLVKWRARARVVA